MIGSSVLLVVFEAKVARCDDGESCFGSSSGKSPCGATKFEWRNIPPSRNMKPWIMGSAPRLVRMGKSIVYGLTPGMQITCAHHGIPRKCSKSDSDSGFQAETLCMIVLAIFQRRKMRCLLQWY